MPVKHEQPTNQAPALYAQVPNQHMPLIDVDGLLQHPIAEAIDEITEIIEDLIPSPRLTAPQRGDLRTILTLTKAIITELRTLAAHNHFHNDTPVGTLSLSKGQPKGAN